MGAGMTLAKHRLALNEPHLLTAQSDGILTFDTDMRAPLKSLRVDFEPVQEGEGDPSPENVRPITGWEGITVTAAGVNLLSPDVFRDAIVGSCDSRITQNADGSITLPNGSMNIKTTAADRVKLFENVLPPGQITIVFYGTYSTSRTMWTVFFTDGTSQSFGSGSAGATQARVYRTNANKTVRFFRLNRDDTKPITYYPDRCGIYIGAPTEYPQFLGSVAPISWTSEAGTVYGGYLEWLRDGTVKLTKTMEYVTGLENASWSRGVNNEEDGYVFFTTFGQKNAASKVLCSRYKYAGTANSNNGAWNKGDGTISVFTGSNKRVYVRDDRFDGVIADFKASLTGMQLVYTLATPVTYTLTPAEALRTLRGENNIWSDTSGPISATYWTY